MFLLRNSRISGSKRPCFRRRTSTGTGAPATWDVDSRRNGSNAAATAPGTGLDSVRVPGVPPPQAKVVICGGGVMGAAVAYYLGLSGWGEETVLIEQEK